MSVARTNSLRLGVGIKVLRQLFEGFGIDGAAFSAAHARARYLRFTIESPEIQSVDPISLGKWLKTAKPDLSNPVARYLRDPDLAALIITETLTSNRLTVTALDASQQDVEVDLPSVQSAIGADLNARVGGTSSGEVSYSGPQFLTFGFKAFRLEYSVKRWAIQGIRPGEVYLGSGAELRPSILSDGWIKVKMPRDSGTIG